MHKYQTGLIYSNVAPHYCKAGPRGEHYQMTSSWSWWKQSAFFPR